MLKSLLKIVANWKGQQRRKFGNINNFVKQQTHVKSKSIWRTN